MITTQTFDLDTVRADEARIFVRVGRFTVEAAHIDQRLIFGIGLFDKFVTVLSQQLRVLNLALCGLAG